MKRRYVCVGVVALICLTLVAYCGARDRERPAALETAWGKEVEGLKVGVRLSRTKFAFGEPIVLHVTVKSVTPEGGSFTVSPRPWVIKVRDHRGRSVPYTRYGERFHEPAPSSAWEKPGFAWVSPPGIACDFYTRVFLLERIADLTEEGTYSVSVSMRYPFRGKLKSGSVTFEVGGRFLPGSSMLYALDKPVNAPDNYSDISFRRGVEVKLDASDVEYMGGMAMEIVATLIAAAEGAGDTPAALEAARMLGELQRELLVPYQHEPPVAFNGANTKERMAIAQQLEELGKFTFEQLSSMAVHDRGRMVRESALSRLQKLVATLQDAVDKAKGTGAELDESPGQAPDAAGAE